MENRIELFETIRKVFGKDLTFKKKAITSYPFIYSENFDVYDVDGAFDFVLIIPKHELIPFDIARGLFSKVKEDFKKITFIYIYDSSKKNKQLYLDSNLNFVSSDGDCRMFNVDKIKNVHDFDDSLYKGSYTKITQLVVNFYLSNETKEYSVREISNKYNFSFSSVSRSNNFLHELGALVKTGTGNHSKYRIKSKKDLLEAVKPFLINPIKRRELIYLSKNELKKSVLFLSGENAISYYTDLESISDFIEIAIDRSKFKGVKSLRDSGSICYLEEFIYDPSYFAIDNTISPFDTLIIAYKRYNGNDDPRIRDAIKTLEKRIINGK